MNLPIYGQFDAAMAKTNVLVLQNGPGDKQFSVRMEWTVVGTPYKITRHVMGASVNAANRSKAVEWFVVDGDGKRIAVPATVHKHEKSIAKWILAHKVWLWNTFYGMANKVA